MTDNKRERNKWYLIECFGLTCFRCGLDANKENIPIWHFHHIDEKKKKYNVCSIIATSEFNSVVQEIKDTCVLVCANCHAMITSKKQIKYEIYYKWLEKKERKDRIYKKVKESGLLVEKNV